MLIDAERDHARPWRFALADSVPEMRVALELGDGPSAVVCGAMDLGIPRSYTVCRNQPELSELRYSPQEPFMNRTACPRRSNLRAARNWSSLLVVAASVAWGGIAAASDTFPGELVTAVPMSCTPGCAVCHLDNYGGRGTAVKPFAGAMIQNGLLPLSPATVKPAVEALRAKNGNLDRDTKLDFVELAAGEDPNVFGATSVCIPTYGCGARIAAAPIPERSTAAVLLGVAALVFVGRRRLFGKRR